MIRREEAGAYWVIQQTAHAFLAAQIVARWRWEASQPLLREELVLAAAAHDAGWVTADEQPRPNLGGYPRTFTEMDLHTHFDIWTASIETVYAQNRFAGLLTSQHCTALYEQRLRFLSDPPDDRAQITAFLARWYDWQRALIAALFNHPRYARAVEPETLALHLRLLQVCDYLSLLLCMGPVMEQSLNDVPLPGGAHSLLRISGDGARAMTLDPFPLTEPLVLWVDARQVIGAPFKDAAALRAALQDVPYKPLVFEIGP